MSHTGHVSVRTPPSLDYLATAVHPSSIFVERLSQPRQWQKLTRFTRKIVQPKVSDSLFCAFLVSLKETS